MSSPLPTEPGSSHEFVKQSSLYQEFLAEREEILRHKWLESERLGYDIGFERALLDWIRKHRDGWRAHRRALLLRQQNQSAPPQAPGSPRSLSDGFVPSPLKKKN
jgi:hypothetical protein